MKRAVYRWRVDLELLERLEALARGEGRSVAALLEDIARAWIERDDATQRARHERVSATIGVLHANDPGRAADARERVRARIAKRRARAVPRSRA